MSAKPCCMLRNCRSRPKCKSQARDRFFYLIQINLAAFSLATLIVGHVLQTGLQMRRHLTLAALIAVASITPVSVEAKQGTSLSRPEASATHHPQYVTRYGRRKPPGAALDERGGTTPSLEYENRQIDEHVLQSICKDAPECRGGHFTPRRVYSRP